MAALTTVTNASFDTACAAVPTSVGGALTRIGDLEADPVIEPNSHIPIAVDTLTDVRMYISYDQLVDVNVRNRMVLEAGGLQGQLASIFNFIAAMDAFNDVNGTFDPWLATEEDYMGFMRLFQTNLIKILNSHPIEVWHEVPANAPLQAAFTEVFSDPTNTVTNTTEKAAVAAFVWDWDDGTYSFDWEPAAKSYTPLVGEELYTVRLICIGSDGKMSIATGTERTVAAA